MDAISHESGLPPIPDLLRAARFDALIAITAAVRSTSSLSEKCRHASSYLVGRQYMDVVHPDEPNFVDPTRSSALVAKEYLICEPA